METKFIYEILHTMEYITCKTDKKQTLQLPVYTLNTYVTTL